MELLRDTAFGHVVRFVTKRKLRQFQYYENRYSEVWREYVDADKTVNVVRYGQVEPPDKEFDETNNEDAKFWRRGTSIYSARTRVLGDEENNKLSGTRIDPEKGKNIHLVAFLPNDPENPQNWSLMKKVFVTFQICLLTVSVYVGSAIYNAGVLDVIQVFGVSQVAALLGLTLFVAGYGLGPMIWSPLSEIPQIGRNPIYISTLLLFIPTALAVNFGMLLAFRFLTGFFGSPVLATGGATLADIWSPKKRAYAIGIWGVAAVCSPTLALELMWLSGFAFVLLFFCLPETSANNILYRRVKRLRKLTGNNKLVSESELIAEEMTPRDIMMMSLVRPFTLNFTEPMVFLLSLYIALIYGLLYIWSESLPIVFTGIYGFSLSLQGVAFMGILVGALIVIPPFFWYLHKYLEPQFDEKGEIQPEKRLPPAFIGGFAISICLFWFGWSARLDVHWIMPIIGSPWFSIGSFLLFNSVLNYLPDAYPNVAASVLAGNDLFRSAFGAGFPLFANAMYTKLGVAWASSLLGFLSILFIPTPITLYKAGPKLRREYSRHARKHI
ncbi:multidrug resistance protein [Colletotrichum acutatum]|uniref:Multidrug resistance protein n=1 Tax=Glomerella acutata TaxID=27357 RepID=A0AAD8XFF7_GLOAC|nr:multidrug resistance protein [Colletotrichum acutatum]KAK1719501.1 multidrug resistance protein [Colletotrichum acutatum]